MEDGVPDERFDRFAFPPTPENLDKLASRLMVELAQLYTAGGLVAVCVFKEQGHSKSQQRCAANLIINLADPESIANARSQLRGYVSKHHLYVCLNQLSVSGVERL